jgi:hypothetical protein
MRRMVLFFLVVLFMFGCDAKHPPSTIAINQDLIYETIPTYDDTKSVIPYNINKFKDVLDKSKYQSPHDETTIDYGGFDNYKSKNFYADSDENLYFVLNKKVDAEKERSELRQGPNPWSTADTEGNYWVATLKCFKPALPLSSYTWMQIHGTQDTFNYPILRLLWVRNREGIYDHIWAITIISNPNEVKIYDWVDLGPRPDGFFNAAVYILNNVMDILINDKIVKTYNVAYWEDVQNYFKAGIYINLFKDGGEGGVAFKELHFLDSADSEYVHLPHR